MSHNEIKDTKETREFTNGYVTVSDPYGVANELMPMVKINFNPTINYNPVNTNTNNSNSVSNTSNPVTDNRKTNPNVGETAQFVSTIANIFASLFA